MKSHSEWLAHFRSFGFDNGVIWHLMHDMYALGLVREAAPVSKEASE